MKTTGIVALNTNIAALLKDSGYDCDRILHSVNCALGRAQKDGTSYKLGKANFKPKTGFGSITEAENTTYVSQEVAVVFLAWHDDTVKMTGKYGVTDSLPVPRKLVAWMEKHKIGAKVSKDAEKDGIKDTIGKDVVESAEEVTA
jgi:hypothetical protein